MLKAAGLVTERRDGRRRLYRLDPSGLAALRAELEVFWDDELTRLAAEAERFTHPFKEPTVTDAIEKDVLIKAGPDEVFALLTEPDRLRRWQTVSAGVDLRAGGSYRFTIVPDHVAAGTFEEVEPGQRLVYTWGWEGNDGVPPGSSTIVVELEPEGDATRLRFRHEGLPDDEAVASHTEGWSHYLDRLAAAAETGDAGPDEWAVAPEELDPISAAEASWTLTQRVLRNFTAADRDKPTPCTEFTVHQLVEHLIGSLQALGGAGGAETVELPHDSAEGDVAVAVEAALRAYRERGLDGIVNAGGNEFPATAAMGIIAIELLVHGWDFAQATGQSFDPPDHLSEFVLGATQAVVTPEARGEGKGFAEELPVDDAASSLERLIAYTGRAA